jgi:NADH-quinone oxidoreductase subunit G
VTEGMVVHTNSQKAEDGRRTVLEFLLANHPLDCPVCDQSGECDLQNFYMNFGLYDPKFREMKVKKKKAVELGRHVMLDQERCILCSRCERFTDEVSKTGEIGIFQRGDRAEVGLFPGITLDNPYSANVVDICPVGALTEKDFRFKARVWYLSSAPTLCNGCAQGCNIDVHFVLNRPHLNEGARVLRLKPRFNAEVNQWWMCDPGRYSFGWVDKGRLTRVRHQNADSTWDQAMAAISSTLAPLGEASHGSKIAVLASTQLTTEELFLIREIFQTGLGAKVGVFGERPPGFSDDFLIKADKNPNARGAELLGMADAKRSATPEGIVAFVNDALKQNIEALWVFGHDLTAALDSATMQALVQKVPLIVYSGTNESPTASRAHWTLPTAAHLEKDGTFVNFHGRLQRIGRSFPPIGDAREDWSVLLELGRLLKQPVTWRSLPEIFKAMAGRVATLEGLTYDTIGAQGAQVASSPAAGAAAR